MPDLTVYRLAFQSGFHRGTRGVNLEETDVTLPSDTLFAALVDALVRNGGEVERFIAPFPRQQADSTSQSGDPPFLLTSAFPFVGQLYFFPMPLPLQRFFAKNTLQARRKELKRIRFVSEALFRRLLAGEQVDDWLFPEDDRIDPTMGVALQGGTFWLTAAEQEKLPKGMRRDGKMDKPIPLRALRRRKILAAVRVPRVTVDRVSSASEIFHAGRVSFAPGCGLWFGVAWRRPQEILGQNGLTFQDAFERALAMLADDGLGGERSVGYGAFSCKKACETLTLDDPAPGGLALLLSRYHPRSGELSLALSGAGTGYDLVPISGWLRSWAGAAQRRKRLWLVGEGSVVRTVGAGPWGDVVDVRPAYNNQNVALPHPVWRYGLALGAALKEAHHG
jgi:CRISPR-associated protein Csm4